MPLILSIETGTEVCSIALSDGDKLLGHLESNDGMAHGRLLSPYIETLLREQNVSMANLDAVAVSEGPGSYTGLRIGVSTAKGICYGTGKPLIAVNSLQSLTMLAMQLNPQVDLLCPMIDARRMEVYTALFNTTGEPVNSTSAEIINEQSFSDMLHVKRIAFFGNGAAKCKETILSPNAVFLEVAHSAIGMIPIAYDRYLRKDFVDTAYFEPLYLKDFIVTSSKKSLL